MLNDEQILLKTAQLLENFDISEQKTEKLLRELDETEYEIVTDVLDDLAPDDLAFNELFAGKMRLIINFPTMDNQSELGQFAEELKQVLKLNVDWEKGMVSAQREWTENSIENDEKFVSGIMGGESPKKVNRKFQMKIGKYFAKVDKLLRDYKEMRQKIAHEVWEGRQDNSWGASFSIGQIKDSLTTDELKRYYQIQNGLELYVGFDSMGGLNKYYAGYEEAQKGNHTKMPQLAKYWQENAGYIKKNIGELTNDKYSIILTRSPIDVMRMSDFNKITSCHSPPSRGSTTGYYKCAVAEAHGHGALAYVVPTEDLLEQTDSQDLQEAENAIQEGEIFDDEIRGSHIGMGLTPVSRTRLRQVRYYPEWPPKRWDEGTEVAMPEKRVYGAAIPGFVDRVIAWARENQQEAIENMPKDAVGDGVDLDKFMMFGGSYEDTAGATGRRTLMSALTGRPIGDFEGHIRQNTETEDTLDHNAISGIQGQWENEVSSITEEWNDRYAAVNVEAEVEDDGDGGLFITARSVIKLSFNIKDFVKMPNSHPTAMEAFDYINDIYGDIFKTDEAWINSERGSDMIYFACDINMEHPEISESAFFYEPDGLNQFCGKIDTAIDDKYEGFHSLIEGFLKMEGWYQGAAYVQLVNDIDNKELSSYEWDVRTDGEYATDSYESTASTSHDFDPEELGVNPKVLEDILNSTGWRVMIRQELLKPAKEELQTSYNVDLNGTSVDISGSEHVGYLVQYNIEFIVNQDTPDEIIELFKELVTGDMDDSDALSAVFNNAMKHTLNARLPASQQQNLDERLVRTWKGYLGI